MLFGLFAIKQRINASGKAEKQPKEMLKTVSNYES
jgi:hypothetical protein